MTGDRDGESEYWFPAKRFGWGWGPPRVWQGWVVLCVWGLALAAGILLLHKRPLPTVCLVVVMSLVLVLICYAKGEPPAWRWGSGR
jgi:hypothetical protein